MATEQCDWVRRFLGPWKDGELDPGDASRIEQHVAVCPECDRQARFERWFSGEVRRLVERPRAPQRVLDRMSLALRREDRRRRVGRWFAYGGGLAAAAGLVGVLLFAVRRPAAGEGAGGSLPSSSPALAAAAGEGADAVERDLIDRHRRATAASLPLELASADSTAVSTWFDGKVAFPVAPPRFSRPDIRLVGGRLTHVREADAAYLGYRTGDRPVSLLVFPAGDRPLPGRDVHRVGGRTIHTGSRPDGLSYAAFRQGDLVYALVAELPLATLVELAAAIR
jgi:anti-sigma factor RsiW